MNILWTEKYKPLNLSNFVGNKIVINELDKWISNIRNIKIK